MFKLNQMYTQIYKDKLLFSYQSKCKCCYETFITFTQYILIIKINAQHNALSKAI